MRLSLVLLLLLLVSEPTDTLLVRTRGPACLVSADDALQSCDCDWTQGGDNCHIEDDGSRCFCMCCCPHMSTGFQCGWHQRARVHQSCSSGGGSLPMVYLLGSQKSGTTSLIVDMMVSMPALLAPVIPDGRKGIDPEHYSKELHFFDTSERFAGGAKLLTSYFPRCDELKRTGRVPVEATPNYFASEGMEGMDPWDLADKFYTAEEVPDHERDNLVFIIIVRDPVHRFISAYNHFCVRERDTFGSTHTCQNGLLDAAKKAVNTVECSSTMYIQWQCFHDLLKKGVYWIALEGWIERFPKAKFIVTTFQHYLEDPNSVLRAIGGAAGVAYTPRLWASHANVAGLSSKAQKKELTDMEELSKLLGDFYQRHDARFWELLNKYRRSKIHRVTYLGQEGRY